MKIFVSAYACEPNLGSEIGVGWHWVLEMSKYFELWVLTRESNRKNIEPWIAEHPAFEGIHWIYFDLPKWARWWKKGLRGVRTYYNIWQWASNGIVERTMKENAIEVFHHLTYGNAMWTVSRYGQRQHFIWGPIGGVETIPEEFTREYGAKERLLAFLRRLNARWLSSNSSFQRRCERASLIICKTEAMQDAVAKEYRGKTVLMTDVACDESEYEASRYEGETARYGNVRFMTVGRLDAWRGFDLTLAAFDRLAEDNPNVELLLVGEGSDRKRLEHIICGIKHGDKVRMTGQVSQQQYHQLLRECDVVVNAALKEGAVTVALDAIAYRKPLVCIETGGYTRLLNDKMSTCIPLSHKDAVIAGLTQAMKRFCQQEQRSMAAEEERRMQPQLSWEAKGRAIRDEILKNCQY